MWRTMAFVGKSPRSPRLDIVGGPAGKGYESSALLLRRVLLLAVGIAVGFLISALHRAGLATLTHTPAPMTFLREICGRPESEKPFVIMPVGYPADDCVVPDIGRKPLEEISEVR